MREPAFWHRPASLSSYLLLPVSALYGAIAASRMTQPGFDVGIPVLCIGNYHVGGAGKTTSLLVEYHRPTPLLQPLTFDIDRTVDETRITSRARLLRGEQPLCTATMLAVAGDRARLSAVSPRRSPL